MFCAALVCASPALAEDKLAKYPVDAALAKGQSYHSKLDPAIKLYFAGQPTPAAKTILPADSGHKRTNAFNKPEQEACDIAFLSAAISLQQYARRTGGNAVVNITSYFKTDRLESASEYLCAAGFLMTAVGLRGTVVTLGE
ncbi:MAG: excinuclease ABC subunit A [Betaproteobacteria bacterium]|nr:MAG: excinuclease ABC subunit A [Betaproteobacteria bacterium]